MTKVSSFPPAQAAGDVQPGDDHDGPVDGCTCEDCDDERDAERNRAAAATLAAGLRQLASMITLDPSYVGHIEYAFSNVLAPIGDDNNPRKVLADVSRATLTAGGKVEKYYNGDNFAGVYVSFGPVSIQVYANREQVCERVVTGTREVVREVPDPDALAAVPTVQTTVTEDVVEWRCVPLLVDDAPEAGA